jgi:hypothetical protein
MFRADISEASDNCATLQVCAESLLKGDPQYRFPLPVPRLALGGGP